MKSVVLIVGDENGLRSGFSVGRRQNPTTPLEEKIVQLIRNGEAPPKGTGDREIANALLRLRRRGIIKNVGGRAHPKWIIPS